MMHHPKPGLSFKVALILAGLVLFQGSMTLRAQTSFGGIVGTITDTSHAAIPGAHVTVTNTQTGIWRSVLSDQYGNYTVSSLLPGTYSVSATQKGFRVTEAGHVVVQVARTVTVNLTLQVGQTKQVVQVTSKAPLLDTTNGTVGTVVNSKFVTNIPLNGRSFTDLMMLAPGAAPATESSGYFYVSGGHNFSIAGNDESENNFTLDGISDNETFYKDAGLQPSIDAVQEFRIQTNVTSAQYGDTAGTQVSVALKSGTNHLHGSAFEFVRNDKFDANDFFRNYYATPTSPSVKPAFKQNDFGGVVGGPVVIPHLYNGRNRAFWLFNFEALRIRRQSTAVGTVPTPAEINGDLSGLPPIYDPATTHIDPATGNLIRDRMSCNGALNVICPGRIDPAMAAMASIMWPSVNTGGAGNIVNTDPASTNAWQTNIRGDYTFTKKLSSFVRVSHSYGTESTPFALPQYKVSIINDYYNAAWSWTYVPTPTTVLDVKLGMNRTGLYARDSAPGMGPEQYMTQYPLQGVALGYAGMPVYTQMSVPGYTTPAQYALILPQTDLMTFVNLTKVMGRNTFHTGFEYHNYRGLDLGVGSGGFGFSALTTADLQNTATTGSSLASFLLGLPSAGSRSLGDQGVYLRGQRYAGYVQDDVRATQELTLDLGLRYEYTVPLVDAHNHMSMFDRTSNSYVWAGNNPVTGQPANARRSIRNPDWNNFAPRFGFAYQFDPKTVVRGGFSVFYSTNYIWNVQSVRGQWPYAVADHVTGTNETYPTMPVETYFPAYVVPQPGTPPSSIYALGRTDRTGYAMHWNLGVQRQLARNLMLEVDYVATRGVKMGTFITRNTPRPGPGLIGSPQHPYPYPKLQGTLAEADNLGTSIYHSLQVKLNKNFSNGLQLLASYAWGHYISLLGGGGAPGQDVPNQYNINADYGNGVYDYRHTFSAGYFYQLPFGRGRQYLNGVNPFVNGVLGGWNVSGITSYRTGAPINVNLTFDNANTGSYGQRPDLVLGMPQRVSVPGDPTQGWLNPASYAVPAQYTFGNLGKNTGRGPGFGDWDIGLYKNFGLDKEGAKLQFRSEFFNAFNHTNFGTPNPYDGSSLFCTPIQTCNPNFGRIFSTANPSREIQFALKLLF